MYVCICKKKSLVLNLSTTVLNATESFFLMKLYKIISYLIEIEISVTVFLVLWSFPGFVVFPCVGYFHIQNEN